MLTVLYGLAQFNLLSFENYAL